MHTESNLLEEYRDYLCRSTTKYLSVKLIAGLLILIYFVFSDIWLVENIHAAYTRILPVSLIVFLLAFHLLAKGFSCLKTRIYNIVLASLPLMMYAKCLIHLDDPGFAGHVTGLVLVIFLVSIDIRTTLFNTIIIYLLPALVFLFVLLSFFEPGMEQLTDLSNVVPIIVLGFTANRIQNKFRFELFRSGFRLKEEKNRTERLLEKVQETNRELNKTNAELERKEKELRKMISTKEKYFSIIAHDLKSPFNALKGFADLLASEDPRAEPDKVSKYTESIQQASHKLYYLTENLLNWSRSQLGEIVRNTETLNVSEIVNDSIETLTIQSKAKGIELQQSIDKELKVRADRETLSIVLRNLLSNAIKYSYRGGRVMVSAFQKEDKIVISVADNGTGIPAGNLDRLFDFSENLSTRGTSGETGSGLGLVLCSEFTELNNGRIWAESKEGQGSTFYLEFPDNVTD